MIFKQSLTLTLLLCSSLAFAGYRYTAPQKPVYKIAIIIDDIGYNIPLGLRTIEIQGKLTLAVLPKTPGAKKLAKAGFAAGKEIMLHAPMSNKSDIALGPGGLTPEQDKQTFLNILSSSIDAIPHIRGVNNHMGSELTTHKKQMNWVMEVIKPKGLYFIDSLTNGRSVALKVAQKHGIVSQKRDIFLDHIQNEEAIEKAFHQLIQTAQLNGFAIGIGHPYPETLNVLERLLPSIDSKNIELVHISTLLEVN